MANAVFRAADGAPVDAPATVADRLFAGGLVLADGAMGTTLVDRGIPIHHGCEQLNLSHPETVASVHAQYLQAGAEIIETNTFGANAFRLDCHELRDRVPDINLAGVRIARQSILRIPNSRAGVAGAVGPLGVRLGEIELPQARAAFAEQIRALAEGGPGVGVDLLILETMTSLAEATEAICAAREVAPGLRLVVMMTVEKHGFCLDGASAEAAAARLTQLGADALGCNCSCGPESVLDAIQRMRTATSLPLAAMPSAGLPCAIEGRNIYIVSRADMASCTHKLIHDGASLIGGCCGSTPDHIRAIQSVILACAECRVIAAQAGESGVALSSGEENRHGWI